MWLWGAVAGVAPTSLVSRGRWGRPSSGQEPGSDGLVLARFPAGGLDTCWTRRVWLGAYVRTYVVVWYVPCNTCPALARYEGRGLDGILVRYVRTVRACHVPGCYALVRDMDGAAVDLAPKCLATGGGVLVPAWRPVTPR